MKKVICKKGLSTLMAATLGLTIFTATGAGITNAVRTKRVRTATHKSKSGQTRYTEWFQIIEEPTSDDSIVSQNQTKENSEEKKPKKNTDCKNTKKIKKIISGQTKEDTIKSFKNLETDSDEPMENILDDTKSQISDISSQTVASTDLTDILEKLLENRQGTITHQLENGITISLSLQKNGFWVFSSESLVINCNDKNYQINLSNRFLQTLANNGITHIISEVPTITEARYRWSISKAENGLYNYNTDYTSKN